MIIERNKNEIIFKIPASVSIDDLQDFANFFEFMEVTRGSKATQKQADDLVKDIKKGRWSKTKSKLGL